LSGTNDFYWVNSKDTGEFHSYLDLLDNWQLLGTDYDGFLLRQSPNDASQTTRAVGFPAGTDNEGDLFVEVLAQERVNGVLWFKVAEITSTLCDKGYPWDLRTTGWIRAHFDDGRPVFSSFMIC